ncbi:NAD-dependent epimerase/dehydratase family protein [Actinopolymorpha cephalotaxi]|nr:NAD(P)-dependent oxidoreductase [Actinopolymorpha cephalotaxi]NYH86250.1 uronate dehydrogenase [Actinopolymorpha cephalotaxi]
MTPLTPDGTDDQRMTQRRVLLTGAAGNVSRLLLPGLAGYSLRLTDRADRANSIPADPIPADSAGSAGSVEVRPGDLADPDFVAEVVAGMDTVVHLAADPSPQASWADLRGPNFDVVASVLEAALAAGVRRVVLASSVHAMGAYVRRGEVPIDPAWPPSPCCLYGTSKAFTEAIGRTYAYRTELSVVCLRFGGVQPRPGSVGGLPSWIGPEDLRALVVGAVEADAAKVPFGVYHGISANTRHEWDTGNATADLGYTPTMDSEAFAGSVSPDEERGLCAVGPLP